MMASPRTAQSFGGVSEAEAASRSSSSSTTAKADQAAVRIQRRYRSFRGRRQEEGLMLAKDMWHPVVTATQLILNNLQYEGAQLPQGSVKKQWLRAGNSAARLGKGSAAATGDTALLLRKEHWLEATDSQHRYGSNLRPYHEYWMDQPTTEPFFYWLDHGAGKEVDLPERPRRRLNSEKLHYCSPDEREQLEATLDDKGLLRYKRSGELVHTLSASEEREMADDFEAWKRADVTAATLSRARQAAPHAAANGHGASNGESHGPSEEELAAAKKRRNANKWIFVTSTDGARFYLAPKVKGRFQHSSFLAGGAISAAGAIMVNQGQIIKLSPMSGHYVPDLDQYIAFLDRLAQQKVDLSQALLLNPFPPVEGSPYAFVQVDNADVDDHTD